MEKSNLIIADNENRLLYIGDALLSTVLKKQLPSPVGYSAGCLKEKDCFTVFLPNAQKLSAADRNALQRVCDEPLPQSGAVIVAGVYPGKDVKCLIKHLKQEELTRQILLDTVFHGKRLQIRQDSDYYPDQFTFQVDAQQVSLHISVDESAIPLLLFNEEGIRYYGLTPCLSSLLSGCPFPSFWDRKKLAKEHPSIQQLLDPSLVSSLRNAAETKMPQIIKVYRYTCLVNCTQIPDWYHPAEMLYVWEVRTEDDILSELQYAGNAYACLIRSMQNEMTGGYTFSLWGNDEGISRIRWLLQKASVTNTTILLTGESGTGKTFLAKEIHLSSRRQNKAFIHVNCAAIPYNLIESELFGYESGAFTGARPGGKAGYFELAEGGTLFLDEITELPLSLQGKLLEVMQSKTYFRVGGEKKRQADVRLIAATNKDLPTLISENKFREDLYYRVNVFPIELPPLRDRMDSLFAIVTDLLPEICDNLGVDQQVISMDALKKMKKYHWPGNIRELENVIEKACILSNGHIILPDDIDLQLDNSCDNSSVFASDTAHTLRSQKEIFEKEVITKALKLCGGNRLKTARYLDIGKTSLFEKLKKYGISDGSDTAHPKEREDR